jgi:NAD(P)-dependent dehydrogenase (short-subunit alcohol dehydrogenase family)
VRNGEPRVALITGANRGLGFETSRQLLAKGLTVVWLDENYNFGNNSRALYRQPQGEKQMAISVRCIRH